MATSTLLGFSESLLIYPPHMELSFNRSGMFMPEKVSLIILSLLKERGFGYRCGTVIMSSRWDKPQILYKYML